MKQSTITFIIIAYNEEKTIKNCISSILAQKVNIRFTIIVVDDGSKDNTCGVVEELGKRHNNIMLIKNGTNRGRGYSRNNGVKNAKTDLIVFVDADIILPHDWLERCLNNINNYDAVGGTAIPDGDVQYPYCNYDLKP